jgi:hypothetical protein
MCHHRFNKYFQAPILADFQGYLAFQASYPNPYASNNFGYGVPRPTNPPRPPILPSPYPLQYPTRYHPPYTQPNDMLTSATIVRPNPNTSWFPDSGAFYHVTKNSHNIQQCSPIEGPDQIFIGNGQGLLILSSGSSTFPSF